jgi:predicted dienelactone hydrolase
MIRRIFAILIILLTISLWALDTRVMAQSMPLQSRDLVLHDRRRNGLSVPIRVTWISNAAASGKKPLIIFSHGSALTTDSYEYLINYWASHDYVCIRPQHADSMAGMRGKDEQTDPISFVDKDATDGAGWVNRARDITCVIDSLPVIEQQIPAINSIVDTEHIGIGGHSYGAFTSLLVAGSKLPSIGGKNLPEVMDRRVKAVVALSPQGVRTDDDYLGFDNRQSWQRLKLPMMCLTGDRDIPNYASLKAHGDPFSDSPAGDKYMAVIAGATHMTFIGPAKGGNLQQRFMRQMLDTAMKKTSGAAAGNEAAQLQAIELLTTTFWDRYLKCKSSAGIALTSKNGLSSKLGSVVKLEYR